MAGDSRLDRDGGSRLLAAARQLASATNERMAALGEAFDRRFDREPPAPGRFAVDYGADGLPEYEDDL